MDEFSEFQIKEYENISQAHFKTNEVMSSFYRYYILITAVPITTISLAIINFSKDEYSDETKVFGQVIFGMFVLIISFMGIAILAYIEGLRLDAILYARVVNSIRGHFFRNELTEKYDFKTSVLPTDQKLPKYSNYGAHFIIFVACALLNSIYSVFGAGLLYFDTIKSNFSFHVTLFEGIVFFVIFIIIMASQLFILNHLRSKKDNLGY